MSTFITQLDPGAGAGPRLAVKDLIDVEGVPTTAGCKAVADSAAPAEKDAPCMAGARDAGARIVGKANLHELAMLPIELRFAPRQPAGHRIVMGREFVPGLADGVHDVALITRENHAPRGVDLRLF